MAKFLLVEDDIEVAESITESLEMHGYTIEHALTGEDALTLLENFAYDLVILDWELPKISGIEVLTVLRVKDVQTPVIFLTGRKDLDSLSFGLEAGADDFISKPFRLQELLARIRSRLRRPGGLLPATISLGSVTLDPESRKVTLGGKTIHLTSKEFAVLEFLMRRPSRVFSTREILNAVWTAEAEVSDSAVRVCMQNLRRKITSENSPCIIKTEKGGGYTVNLTAISPSNSPISPSEAP